MEARFLVTSLFLLLFGSTCGAPSTSSLVVSTTEPPKEATTETKDAKVSETPEIYDMEITSNVSNRFAKTLVTSKIRNGGVAAKESTFTVVLPEKAFISKFVMEVGGKSYKAYVKEKEEAKNIYDKAVASGQTAAHVSVNARDSSRFTVSLHVEPEAKAAFLLTYEELLERKSEQYELVINIHPGQIVKRLNVEVNINETRPLKFVKTPSLRSGNEISKNEEKLDPSSDITIVNATTAVVKFTPDSEKQKQFAHDMGTKESAGLSGQFVVQYDIERDPHGGEVLLQDGYFVHFFAPSDLQPLPKHVLFVLDTSGSMDGTKISQLKDAMKSILKEIRNGDKISIIEFNSVVKVWDIVSEETVTVTRHMDYQNPFPKLSEQTLPSPTAFDEALLEKAKNVIDVIDAYGSTNIIGGLETALHLVKTDQDRSESDKKHQPVILFLTDGDPNVGMWSTEEIVSKVTELNSKNNHVPIFSLSFGDSANKAFLRKLSLKNQGFSRHIYEASDASLQLQDFYKQISSPLLSGVEFEYDSGVQDVTKRIFPIYFKGSELVVTGRYKGKILTHDMITGPVALKPTVESSTGRLERLWAYLTIKQILEERDSAENKTGLTKKAVDLAMKYSFVTDVTSLVVVKPNDTTAVDTENASSGNQPFQARTVFMKSPRFYSRNIGMALSAPRPTHPPPTLQQSLPWLNSVLSSNGTISVGQSAYKLGLNYKAQNETECQNTPKNSTDPGACVLLRDCQQVYLYLNDFRTYQNYFCPVDNEDNPKNLIGMGRQLFFLFPLWILGQVLAAPNENSFVVATPESSTNGGKEGVTERDAIPVYPTIYEMSIASNVSNRFAKTLIASKVRNAQTEAKETSFTVVLPEKAFISEFVMEVGGKSYKAYVKEKEEAKQIYNQAVASGQSAGHVAVNARDSNKFTVSVNVEPESKVTFLLTYEELLERKNDQYELILNIHPGQIVKDLNVQVLINETRPLKFVRTPSLRSGNEISKNEDKLDPSSDIQMIKSTSAVINFTPDSEKQKQFAVSLGYKESDGLSGQFVVQYDVERDPSGGEVLLQDGYFVHFFAPTDLKPLPKHVLFVLDSSGSMGGRKIDQLKDAMNSILNEIRQEDVISIIDFGNDVSVWDINREIRTLVPHDFQENYEEPFIKLSFTLEIVNDTIFVFPYFQKQDLPSAVPANSQNLEKTKRVLNSLYAMGGTYMIGGLETALYLAKAVQDHPSEKSYQPLMIFLTDGEPNVGLGSTEEITRLVTRLNSKNNNVPIFSLSFGRGADKEFLRKLSLKNLGFNRHIYEASDASLQLQDFYKHISSPLLSNITFEYSPDAVEITKTQFPIYFKGSEIVITGRYNESDLPLVQSPVSGWDGEKYITLKPTVHRPVTSLERLWAYLTVKQTLEERELSDNKKGIDQKSVGSRPEIFLCNRCYIACRRQTKRNEFS
ncbi:hypothetical protein NQ315_004803 [Exocentrus adspersus]|uniref:Inter-alpha-trypsin inhibitor heavy chain H4 n=1 Tax=Exocentrus adspersus TaxID=1586481 RepID=A0AAV8W2B2_9CUCU|nr:hypothetical protein NQ315_004803 [Exocentrus adspersus]